MGSKRIRFGLLCNGYDWPSSSLAIVRSLLELPGVSLELIVVNQTPSRTTSRWSKFKKVITGQGLLWGLRNRLVSNNQAVDEVHDLSQEWAAVPRLDVVAEHRGRFTQLFSQADVEAMRSHDLDFLLKFSFGILRGDVLQSARYGIWSFHHGEPERYRGAPPGFWEVYDGNPVTGAILQRLTEKLDGGVILQRCYTQTVLSSARKNYDRIQQAAQLLPRAACQELLLDRLEKVNSQPVTTNAPIKRNPNDLQYLIYLFKSRLKRWQARMAYLLTDEQWAVGLVKSPIHSFLAPGFKPEVKWLTASSATQFLADPFGITTPDGGTILAEKYDYQRGYGRIVAMAVNADGQVSPLVTALDTATHLSYPCTASDGTHWYMVPENIARRSVVIYRLDSAGQWHSFSTTNIDEPLIDPTLFQHEGRWWIMGTTLDDAQSKLKCWFAESLAGPWSPHLLNPLRIDPRNCRSAGTPFVHDHVLYRPTQNSSKTYGGSVVINRVERLTPDDYAESLVCEVHPQADWPYPHGLHTLSAFGPLTLLDAKRRRFMPSRIAGKLLRRFF